jgi:hypothetical protein
MAIIRQLPKLTLRGSIAKITMANLSREQKATIEHWLEIVKSNPVLVKDKYRVIRELGITIKSDFADSKAAEQEYEIAIWRGLVCIFFHRDYTFKCSSCQFGTYINQRGKSKIIDRQQIPCPNCGKAKIENPGDTSYQVGDVVNFAEVQASFKMTPTATPVFCSTIDYIEGEKKYSDPEKILKDPVQLKKFFSEYVWNYFRQQINENKRVSNTKETIITGAADEMLAEMVLSLCRKMGIDTFGTNKPNIEEGKYVIPISMLLAAPDFTIELADIFKTALEHDIRLEVKPNHVVVWQNYSAATISIPVFKPEHITVVEDSGTEEAGTFSVNQISSKSYRGCVMDQENHIYCTDLQEASAKTRDGLPDDTRMVFDIYMQNGAFYEEYSKSFPEDASPKISHVAVFLNMTARQVRAHRETIKLHCLKNDFVPGYIDR